MQYKNQMEMKLVAQIAAVCRGSYGSFEYKPYFKTVYLKVSRKDYVRANCQRHEGGRQQQAGQNSPYRQPYFPDHPAITA